jgi:hypothetical protein
MAKKGKMGRPTFQDTFLTKLKQLVGKEQKLISNSSLREKLKWEEDRYKRVKAQLLEANQIIGGRGYSGSVGLPSLSGTGNKALVLFVSYSHVDETLKNELLKHLQPLKRLKLIETWHDSKLKPGDSIDDGVFTKLDEADIALFLVSADFINSEYCYLELEKALERQAKGKMAVIPIVLRSCLWKYTALKSLLALPKDGKAVTAWTNQDEAFTNIAEGVRAKAEEILESR